VARRSSTPSHAPLQPQRPYHDEPKKIVDIYKFRRECDEYNRLLPFVQNLSPANVLSAAWRCGAEVEKSMNEIRDFLLDVRQQMNA
jgi:hypothetical protein